MLTEKRKLGDLGEDIAKKFLVEHGFRIKDRNYSFKNLGEIDLIGERNGIITFFEVKTRDVSYETYFPTWMSIDKRKINSMKRIAEIYISQTKNPDTEWQYDAIFISMRGGNTIESIEHLENILI